MTSPFTDLSGAAIPPDRRSTVPGIERILAVPPVRDKPNEDAIEFTYAAYGQLAAGGGAFVQLTDFSTGVAFNVQVPQLYRGRLEAMLVFCPDMVAAAAPYLSFSLRINSQLANAWGQVPIFPRLGMAAPGFEMNTDLATGQTLQLWALNSDAVNAHFLGVYLYGWYWPTDLKQA